MVAVDLYPVLLWTAAGFYQLCNELTIFLLSLVMMSLASVKKAYGGKKQQINIKRIYSVCAVHF